MKREVEKIDGVIEDARIYTNNRYLDDRCHKMTELTDKPEGIPDIVLITAKSDEGKLIETFPILIKYDGTLELDSLTRRRRLWYARFAAFLKHYKLTEKIEDFAFPENLGKWIGKEVKIVTFEGRDQIFIPQQLIRDRIKHLTIRTE